MFISLLTPRFILPTEAIQWYKCHMLPFLATNRVGYSLHKYNVNYVPGYPNVTYCFGRTRINSMIAHILLGSVENRCIVVDQHSPVRSPNLRTFFIKFLCCCSINALPFFGITAERIRSCPILSLFSALAFCSAFCEHIIPIARSVHGQRQNNSIISRMPALQQNFQDRVPAFLGAPLQYFLISLAAVSSCQEASLLPGVFTEGFLPAERCGAERLSEHRSAPCHGLKTKKRSALLRATELEKKAVPLGTVTFPIKIAPLREDFILG